MIKSNHCFPGKMSDTKRTERILGINSLIRKHINTDILRDTQAALGSVYGKQ